jgi:thioester reductase-like protein
MTVIATLMAVAREAPESLAIMFLDRDGQPLRSVSKKVLMQRVSAYASRIAQSSARGDRIVLLFDDPVEFAIAFLACLHAGRVAVPVRPPRTPRKIEGLVRILDDCDPALIVGDRANEATLARCVESHQRRRLASFTDPSDTLPDGFAAHDELELAFLQYTSGSTGRPKGVRVAHTNLLHNAGVIQRHFEMTAHDKVLSWLPLYHDMGLIGCLLAPLMAGASVYLLRETSFLSNPVVWLKAISQHRATLSGAPNFAYNLSCERLADSLCNELDLSTWRIAFCGSEQISPGVMRRFAERFGACGLRPDAFRPVYGLAEATLLAASACAPERAKTTHYHRGDTAAGTVEVGLGGSVELVGHRLMVEEDMRLRIVDPSTARVVPDGQVGEVWLEGPSICQGYWNGDGSDQGGFGSLLPEGHGAFLRTGDLGFVEDGYLYIAGRSKEVVQVRGANIYLADVRGLLARLSDRIATATSAMFDIEHNDEAELVIVVETEAERAEDPSLIALAQLVGREVRKEFGLSVREFTYVRSRVLPRTTSGKVRVQQVKRMWLNGDLKAKLQVHPGARNGVEGEVMIPQTSSERALAKIWSDVLGVAILDRSADFFLLGGDSLNLARLVVEIEEVMGVTVSPESLHRNSSLAAMAEAIDEGSVELPPSQDGRTLPSDLSFGRCPEEAWLHVLVTGASGFYGGEIVLALLTRTSARIHCLVRDRARLAERLGELDAAWAMDCGRVSVVEGDISQPRFGLNDETYDRLRADVDTIFHGAAVVDWVKPLDALYPTNVGGTLEILRLAASGRTKRVFHVSTMWVFPTTLPLKVAIIDETTPTDFHGLETGYSRSKQIAEDLTYQAFDRGLEGAVFRMDFLVGRTGTYELPPNDFLSRFMRDTIRLRKVVYADARVDMIPVDVAANMLVLEALSSSRDRVRHLRADRAFCAFTLHHALGKLGIPIDWASYDEWIGLVRQDPHGLLFPLYPFLTRSARNTRLGQLSYVLTCRAASDEVALLRDQTPSAEVLIAGMLEHILASGDAAAQPQPQRRDRLEVPG